MTIGSRIRDARTQRGWSQRELAKRMGYSNHSTIGKIESGKVDIPQSRIVQFADVLGVTVSYLMNWKEDKHKQSTNQGVVQLSQQKQEFIKRVESMSDEQLDILEKLLDLVENKG